MSEGGCDFLLIFAPPFLTHHEHLSISHMYLDTEKKKEFFAKHGKGATDTGSPEGQIAMFSFRIAHLTEHLKENLFQIETIKFLRMGLIYGFIYGFVAGNVIGRYGDSGLFLIFTNN